MRLLNASQIGNAVLIGYTFSPIGRLSSKPIHIATVSDGVEPTNQHVRESFVVPVLLMASEEIQLSLLYNLLTRCRPSDKIEATCPTIVLGKTLSCTNDVVYIRNPLDARIHEI